MYEAVSLRTEGSKKGRKQGCGKERKKTGRQGFTRKEMSNTGKKQVREQ